MQLDFQSNYTYLHLLVGMKKTSISFSGSWKKKQIKITRNKFNVFKKGTGCKYDYMTAPGFAKKMCGFRSTRSRTVSNIARIHFESDKIARKNARKGKKFSFTVEGIIDIEYLWRGSFGQHCDF